MYNAILVKCQTIKAEFFFSKYQMIISIINKELKNSKFINLESYDRETNIK